jgi:hypothetical protein
MRPPWTEGKDDRVGCRRCLQIGLDLTKGAFTSTSAVPEARRKGRGAIARSSGDHPPGPLRLTVATTSIYQGGAIAPVTVLGIWCINPERGGQP